jgi:hypothetical protein
MVAAAVRPSSRGGRGAASTDLCTRPFCRAHAHKLWMAHRRSHRFSPAVFHVVVKDPDTNKHMPLPSVLPEVDDGVEETVGGDKEEEIVGGGGPVPDSGPPSSPHPTPATAANGAWLAGWLAGLLACEVVCVCTPVVPGAVAPLSALAPCVVPLRACSA